MLPRHLWTPREMQAVFEEYRHVDRPLMQRWKLRARMGVRGPEPDLPTKFDARITAIVSMIDGPVMRNSFAASAFKGMPFGE